MTLFSPWIVDLLAADEFAESSTVVGPLAFSTVSYGAYIVVAIGVGRSRRTQFNWVVTAAGPRVNFGLNILLIPSYGMMGAAIATVAAYTTMAVGMALVGAAGLPGAVPVAPGRDRCPRRRRPGRQPASCSTAGCRWRSH